MCQRVPLAVGTRERDSSLHRAYIYPDISLLPPQPHNVPVLPGITDLMDFTL